MCGDLQCLQLDSGWLCNASKWSDPYISYAPNSAFSGGNELIKVEKDALKQARRELQAQEQEFQRQVKIVQHQVAQQKHEVNAGELELERRRQTIRKHRLTLEFHQQDLVNAQHKVEQQRRESMVLRGDLHLQQEVLLREKEEMARKETARRLRRWN